MIAVFCLLFPSVILVVFRKKLMNFYDINEYIVTYALSLLFVNGLMMFALSYFFGNNNDLFIKLNSYNDFACKYILMASLISISEPYIEKFIKNKVKFHVELPKSYNFPYWRVIVSIYAFILFFLNFIRIFDNNFWGDEAFTTNLIMKSVSDIIVGTASDVHPPLYYLIVKIGYSLFGNQGWMFHFVSLIPCVIIIIFALTSIWNKFGKEASVILITLATISSNAIKFNVEVRMYSWGALFILLSFYYLYMILNDESIKNYCLFVIFSLAAAYTHYYCLISVAFFYIVILFLSLFKNRLSVKKVIMTCIITVIGYLPWFFIMLKSMLDRSDNYWITEIPTFLDSVKYLFSSQFSNFVLFIIIMIIIFAIVYETNILKIEKNNQINVNINLINMNFSNDFIWIISGLFSALGTITFGILISNAITPFYVLRYIYPVSIIAWLVLGICISKLSFKKIITIVLTFYMLFTFIPDYYATYTTEKKSYETLQTTLELTESIGESDVILTNVEHISWTIARYYYPNTTITKLSLEKFPELDKNIDYYLIVSYNEDISIINDDIEKQNFCYEKIVDGGNLGTLNVDIYRIIYNE